MKPLILHADNVTVIAWKHTLPHLHPLPQPTCYSEFIGRSNFRIPDPVHGKVMVGFSIQFNGKTNYKLPMADTENSNGQEIYCRSSREVARKGSREVVLKPAVSGCGGGRGIKYQNQPDA